MKLNQLQGRNKDLANHYFSIVSEEKIYERDTIIGEDHELPWFAREDLERLKKRAGLDVHRYHDTDCLYIQSVHGHALNGDGLFRKRLNDGSFQKVIYPKATLSDIVRAAGLPEHETLANRESLIGMYEQLINNALDYCLGSKRNKKPKRGISELKVRGRKVFGLAGLEGNWDPLFLLKGATTGFVDNGTIREQTLDMFSRVTLSGRPMTLGYGESFFVNTEKYNHLFGDLRYLALVEHSSEMITTLENLDLISRQEQKGKELQYVRRKHGLGTSDDLMFILTAESFKHHGINNALSAMVGAFLTDAADTYDKLVKYPLIEGRDENISSLIQHSWEVEKGKPLVPWDLIKVITYFTAKNNDPKVPISSSHRWLIQRRNGDDTTIDSHMAFVSGEKTAKFKVGYKGMRSDKFYKAAKERARAMRKKIKELRIEV